jgi:hypothetical protein
LGIILGGTHHLELGFEPWYPGTLITLQKPTGNKLGFEGPGNDPALFCFISLLRFSLAGWFALLELSLRNPYPSVALLSVQILWLSFRVEALR